MYYGPTDHSYTHYGGTYLDPQVYSDYLVRLYLLWLCTYLDPQVVEADGGRDGVHEPQPVREEAGAWSG